MLGREGMEYEGYSNWCFGSYEDVIYTSEDDSGIEQMIERANDKEKEVILK